MDVFLDTNILLNFYSYKKDDFNKIDEFLKLTEDGHLTIHITDHVIREFNRKREVKIHEVLEDLRGQSYKLNLPPFIAKEEASQNFVEKMKEAKKLFIDLEEMLLEKSENKSFEADIFFEKIKKIAKTHKEDEDIYQKAKKRLEIGDPPGKYGQIGDRLIWESLIAHFPKGENIHLITNDSDYYCPYDKDILSLFLKDEWSQLKNSEAFIYKSLDKFGAEHFPQIRIRTDSVKAEYVDLLCQSRNFSDTHKYIQLLSNYMDLIDEQDVIQLVRFAEENNQINWILNDDDVFKFYNQLKEKTNSSDMASQIDALLSE